VVTLNFNRFLLCSSWQARRGHRRAVNNHGGEVADYIHRHAKRPLRTCAISAKAKPSAPRSRKSMAQNNVINECLVGRRCAAVDVIRHFAAVFVTLVDDRALLANLSKVEAVEIE